MLNQQQLRLVLGGGHILFGNDWDEAGGQHARLRIDDLTLRRIRLVARSEGLPILFHWREGAGQLVHRLTLMQRSRNGGTINLGGNMSAQIPGAKFWRIQGVALDAEGQETSVQVDLEGEVPEPNGAMIDLVTLQMIGLKAYLARFEGQPQS